MTAEITCILGCSDAMSVLLATSEQGSVMCFFAPFIFFTIVIFGLRRAGGGDIADGLGHGSKPKRMGRRPEGDAGSATWRRGKDARACPNDVCQAENRADARFCRQCGVRLL